MRMPITALMTAATLAGVAPSLAPSMAHATDLNLCTGAPGGNYAFAGAQIALNAQGTSLRVITHNTNGSMQNLDLLTNGKSPPDPHCDAAIAQADAIGVFAKSNPEAAAKIEQDAPLYDEYLHFICNTAADISKITQLTPKQTIAVGNAGGGTWTTWQSFIQADPRRYKDIPTSPLSGIRAANQVLRGDPVSCMLFVTGLKAASIMEANQLGLNNKGALALVATDDSDVRALKDGKEKVYREATFPSGMYPGLQPKSLFGSSVDTLAVRAMIVANSDWIEANQSAFEIFLQAVNRAMPAIKHKVEIPAD
jgi:TRAP transporter TAXI family solute receptor